MHAKIEPGVSSWRFWFQWVIATSISIAIGAGVTMAAAQYVYYLNRVENIHYMATVALAVVVLGFLPGAAQWLVLRRYLPRVGWWILATGGGFILTLIPAYLSYKLDVYITERVGSSAIIVLVHIIMIGVNVLFFGTITGTFQWMVIQNKVSQARRWILASAGGWTVGLILGSVVTGIFALLMFIILFLDALFQLLGWYYNPDPVVSWTLALGGAVIGILSGMITGAAMVRLMQGSNSHEMEPNSESSINS